MPHSRQLTKICKSEYLTLPKDPEGPVVGWFVEIPRSLRDKFDKLYPGRRHKKILTITAIQRAIDLHPKSLYNLYKEPPSGMEHSEQHDEGGSADTAGGPKDGTLD